MATEHSQVRLVLDNGNYVSRVGPGFLSIMPRFVGTADIVVAVAQSQQFKHNQGVRPGDTHRGGEWLSVRQAAFEWIVIRLGNGDGATCAGAGVNPSCTSTRKSVDRLNSSGAMNSIR